MNDMKSTARYVFTLAVGPICWKIDFGCIAMVRVSFICKKK